jgi:hypothetical protein
MGGKAELRFNRKGFPRKVIGAGLLMALIPTFLLRKKNKKRSENKK